MNIAQYQWLFSTLWVSWFFILFTAILVWVLRPSRRHTLQQHAQIPLRDEA
ncbi:cbb3-type cytochrome c oxidase subunit 3 [Rhodovarius sp.]|jgi:cbb3-type cytochrome oxidase subunit 3|uniref:cbb3-type cytochrome oxidase subunit 3 n=1 Tax=Rhodovarius sp. TaxID=2972673 RepID=UPI003340547D